MLEFLTMSGNALDLGSSESIVRNPAVALEKLRAIAGTGDAASDQHTLKND